MVKQGQRVKQQRGTVQGSGHSQLSAFNYFSLEYRLPEYDYVSNCTVCYL